MTTGRINQVAVVDRGRGEGPWADRQGRPGPAPNPQMMISQRRWHLSVFSATSARGERWRLRPRSSDRLFPRAPTETIPPDGSNDSEGPGAVRPKQHNGPGTPAGCAVAPAGADGANHAHAVLAIVCMPKRLHIVYRYKPIISPPSHCESNRGRVRIVTSENRSRLHPMQRNTDRTQGRRIQGECCHSIPGSTSRRGPVSLIQRVGTETTCLS